jgi:hypothetical protein
MLWRAPATEAVRAIGELVVDPPYIASQAGHALPRPGDLERALDPRPNRQLHQHRLAPPAAASRLSEFFERDRLYDPDFLRTTQRGRLHFDDRELESLLVSNRDAQTSSAASRSLRQPQLAHVSD